MLDDAEQNGGVPVAVVGAGAVGTALARRLSDRGYSVRAVLSRDEPSARSLADRVGAAVGTDQMSALPAQVRLIFVCVPDDAIEGVAEELASVEHSWARTLVGHTSGACTSAALRPVADAGAIPFSFHPLQTFVPGTPPEAFDGIAIGIEGPSDAVSAASALAEDLGARPVALSAEDKACYHAAAALASNGLVALMAVVREILSAADVRGDTDGRADLVGPLVRQTWANLETAPPEGVLTGPVARGDRSTVSAHLDALSNETPHLLPLYAALSIEMTRIVVRSGDLQADTAERLLQLLQKALERSSDGAEIDLSH